MSWIPSSILLMTIFILTIYCGVYVYKCYIFASKVECCGFKAQLFPLCNSALIQIREWHSVPIMLFTASYQTLWTNLLSSIIATIKFYQTIYYASMIPSFVVSSLLYLCRCILGNAYPSYQQGLLCCNPFFCRPQLDMFRSITPG